MSALRDSVSIITGAGSGIGRATALAFGAAGAKLILAGRRREPLECTRNDIVAAGGTAVIRPVDLEDGDDAAALGRWALDTYGAVDVLVNNAGHSTRVRSIRYVDPVEFSSVFRVNVEGVYRLTQSLLESMIARGAGTVITVASKAALDPNLLGGIPYGSAKAAEMALMRGLNNELRHHGIRACTIIPGEVNTAVLDARPSPPDSTARQEMMQPEDVAQAIVLCASLPGRTLVEQIVMSPTRPRDLAAELDAASRLGRPD